MSWLGGRQANVGEYTLVDNQFDANPVNSLNRADFVNVKEASVLTGIVTNIWPFAAIALVSVGGVLLVRKTVLAKK